MELSSSMLTFQVLEDKLKEEIAKFSILIDADVHIKHTEKEYCNSTYPCAIAGEYIHICRQSVVSYTEKFEIKDPILDVVNDELTEFFANFKTLGNQASFS